MRQFLILFDNMPIDSTSIRAGSNSSEVITACRCINVGLFLSGNLRKDTTISIALGPLNDLQIFSFPGHLLRRVSPDERSISFFLLKALTISDSLPLNTSRVMDNGIDIRRIGFKEFVESLLPINIIMATAKEETQVASDYLKTDLLLIYDNREKSIPLESLGLAQYHVWPRPPHPERFILDINREMDRGQ